jgi:hypothetical protein
MALLRDAPAPNQAQSEGRLPRFHANLAPAFHAGLNPDFESFQTKRRSRLSEPLVCTQN